MSKVKDPSPAVKSSKAKKPKATATPADTITPLSLLLGTAMGALDHAESAQLLADIAGFFPKSILMGDCMGIDHMPTWAGTHGPHTLHAEPVRPMALGFRTLALSAGSPDLGPFVAGLKDAFDDVQKYYPLRAAALYLRILCRIWVGLMEENRLDILQSDGFIRAYLAGMMQVEAIASRCQDCAYTE